MNSFGHIFRLTTFGESHGPAIGGIIDGVPPGFSIDPAVVQTALDERRPGASPLTSPRCEADRVQLLSGIFEGKTLGTPIGFIIPNTDARSSDYEAMRHIYRPCHADYTYDARYGLRDHRGGGRASARETACRVVAGSIAAQILLTQEISIEAFVMQVGSARRASAEADFAPLAAEISKAQAAHDSVGGIVSCTIRGVKAGIGSPVYGKLQAHLAEGMLSIPGVKGFEYGEGFAAAGAYGSEMLDIFSTDSEGKILTLSNHSGGIQGGISNGAEITMRVAFKPTPTLPRPLPTVADNGQPVTLQAKGRHDPCIALRGCPVVKAMAAIALLDSLLATHATLL